MKNVIAFVMVIVVITGVLLTALCFRAPPQYVVGRLYIRSRGISAQVYTREEEPIDGMSTLWNGGKVTTDADLSQVQVGDMAELYTVEGEHLVLECIDIRKGWGWWLEKPQGDVIVIDGWLVCRLTRL